MGYGASVSVEHRDANGDPTRLRSLADELVAVRPDVLVAGWGTLAPQALKAATTSIPIVFSMVGDPVGAALVPNLGRPGGNITGLSGQSAELKGKQLELLKEVAPRGIVGVLVNPDTPYGPLSLKQLTAAAEIDGTRLQVLEVRTPGDFSGSAQKALLASGASSLLVVEDPVTGNLRTAVVEFAMRSRLPTMTGSREYAEAGALMAYGAVVRDRWRRTAEYVDKILKGTSAGDLPVEQPTHFQFFINLKTANALGLTIPPTLLARADEVIE
jgi:putative ABC transport system substrate-binding protein